MLQDVTIRKRDRILILELPIPKRILSEIGICVYKMLEGIITCYKLLQFVKENEH